DAREMMGSFKKLLPYAAVIFIGMIVASTLTLVLVIKSTDPSRQADKILRSGSRMINEGNLSQGIETLSVLSGYFADNSQLLDKFIHAADVIYEAELVTSEGKMEKYKEAKRIYEQIIKSFPTNDQVLNKGVYFKAADCAKELGLLDDAIKLYDGVITKFQPSLIVARALFEKANTLVEQGKYDQARKIYADIIRDYPDSEFAGRSYFKLAQSYRAEADKIKKEYNIQ
ncbi:MAG: tetratricopeptide repeat protein, partial [Candidatus Aureabacteria bacterium]|nr:tetratricopeptide repeat protein [Candidatus Auribacterota bacterium]